MWPRIVARIFIPVGKHYFQALASTLQFVAQVCDRLWLVPATDRAFAYITYMSPPHVALVCSGPLQCAATCGWTKWPVCSGPYPDAAVLALSRCSRAGFIPMQPCWLYPDAAVLALSRCSRAGFIPMQLVWLVQVHHSVLDVEHHLQVARPDPKAVLARACPFSGLSSRFLVFVMAEESARVLLFASVFLLCSLEGGCQRW